ncbi:MAG: type II toxin-antitoxin system VapC family toxin [Sphingomonadaceae bacterium]|nr:type II toxin-antitoxin system VapC family toxin [Sphingomonadaceae bacterium]
MYLLDTNVVSELRKTRSGRADPRVVAWARPIALAGLFISAITLLELDIGVGRIERRDAAAGRVLRRWLDQDVVRAFHGRILPVDVAVARRCAPLHAPDPRPDRDALIAATALVHALTVVTRSVADFSGAGVPLLDPWQAVPA